MAVPYLLSIFGLKALWVRMRAVDKDEALTFNIFNALQYPLEVVKHAATSNNGNASLRGNIIKLFANALSKLLAQ